MAKKTGRPSLGTTKKVSITLPDEVWAEFDSMVADSSRSEVLRTMIVSFLESERLLKITGVK